MSVQVLVLPFTFFSVNTSVFYAWCLDFYHYTRRPGLVIIKLTGTSCLTQLRMKVSLPISVKMLTILGILTFISRINDWL